MLNGNKKAWAITVSLCRKCGGFEQQKVIVILFVGPTVYSSAITCISFGP